MVPEPGKGGGPSVTVVVQLAMRLAMQLAMRLVMKGRGAKCHSGHCLSEGSVLVGPLPRGTHGHPPTYFSGRQSGCAHRLPADRALTSCPTSCS